MTGIFPYTSTLYEKEKPEDGYWAIMCADICSALGKHGEICEPLPLNKEFIKKYATAPYSITFNYTPELSTNEGSVWTNSTKKVILISLDHPSYLYDQIDQQLKKAPDLKQRFFGVMEEEHLYFMNSMGVPKEQCFLFPQAGPPPIQENIKPIAERSHDIVFLGRVHMPATHEAFIKQLNIKQPALSHALNAAFSKILQQIELSHRDVYSIIVEEIGKIDSSLHIKGTRTSAILTRGIDAHFRQVRRLNLLQQFENYPVNIVGIVAPEIIKRFPNFNFLGPKSFRESATLLNDTKILLNDTINLKSSLLMRFFYGTANGCIIASEINKYVLKEFKPEKEFLPISPRSFRHLELLEKCLSDSNFAQKIANNAMEKYKNSHLWEDRVLPLLKAIQR